MIFVSNIPLDNLGIIEVDYEKAIKCKDDFDKLGLCERLSFDVMREHYVVYLHKLTADIVDKVKNVVLENNYRLVRFREDSV